MASKPRKKPVKRKGSSNPFLGRWIARDAWSTDVSLIVSDRAGRLRVRAVDQSDGEAAEVFDIKHGKRELSFAAHWSSGQFTKYRLCVFGGDEVLVTFTFTNTVTFRRS